MRISGRIRWTKISANLIHEKLKKKKKKEKYVYSGGHLTNFKPRHSCLCSENAIVKYFNLINCIAS